LDYSTDTATSTTPGSVSGFFASIKLAHGELDIATATPIQTQDLYSHTNAAGVVITSLASVRVYGAA
jgi:hypothetical protein